jgi:hypothetical protein
MQNLINNEWLIWIDISELNDKQKYFEEKYLEFIRTSSNDERYHLVNNMTNHIYNTNKQYIYKNLIVEFQSNNGHRLDLYNFISEDNSHYRKDVRYLLPQTNFNEFETLRIIYRL